MSRSGRCDDCRIFLCCAHAFLMQLEEPIPVQGVKTLVAQQKAYEVVTLEYLRQHGDTPVPSVPLEEVRLENVVAVIGESMRYPSSHHSPMLIYIALLPSDPPTAPLPAVHESNESEAQISQSLFSLPRDCPSHE